MHIVILARKALSTASILMTMILMTGCSEPSLDTENTESPDEITEKLPESRYYRGHRAAFMGDSITQMWNEDEYGHPEFFERNNYLNKGISGQTTTEMIQRFKRDILDDDPGCVVICAGTNDFAGNGGWSKTPEEVFNNLKVMFTMAEKMELPILICSVLPVFQYNWNTSVEPAEMIVTLNTMLKGYAETNGHTYVDYWTPLADERKGLPEKYSFDGVHPTKEAYMIMEGIIKPAINSVLGTSSAID